MIQEFVDAFMAAKPALAAKWKLEPPESYEAIVEAVVEAINPGDEDSATYGKPLKSRIHVIDDGDYQGTQLFIIGECAYQPSDYWAVCVSYGSCSGCDTLEGLRDYSTGESSDNAVEGYLTLALNIVQEMKAIT